MLGAPVSSFVLDDSGKVTGVKTTDGQVARCKMVVCDPSYIKDQFPSRLRTHGICLKGKTIAIVSTTVETDDPEKELEPALKLLGTIEEKFVSVSDMLECTDTGKESKIFVSKSFDATSHFESATQDVLKMWEDMMGEPLDLSTKADPEDLQEQ
ncbi:RAB GDP dissociation inhibitor alpha, putative [Eimeria mitis]|uniref:RAB GDP dissociation inhibitor alpha, putative n=1 Tax=Eimeria mitis TaxID=44415 RepID=U6KDQ0_9EIME|nr:RAB GDP dissociation inhibitor alpha, putative [Eimeria mitis]CDJ33613.1 RAB GDP dissociation inhibitor alpha, putative [Eimeria mitis]